MANNFQVNVYQINGKVLPRDQSQRIGFPSTGIMIQDCIGSPTRSLSSGYNVYSVIIVPSAAAANSQGNYYYIQETFSALATLVG